MTGLLAAARAGDRRATAELLAHHRAELVRRARAAIGPRLRAKVDASDVVQDVLVKAQRGLAEFRGTTDAEVAAWMGRILERTLADADRRYRRTAGRAVERERAIEEDSAGSASPRALVADDTSPTRGAVRRETSVRVRAALAELRPHERQVIELRSLEGFGWSDVAERMGRSTESVRCLWGRAMRRLGSRVQDL